MTSVPSGTVTFLFTDIEGSTQLWQQFPDTMPAALARHHDIMRDAIESHKGCVFQIIGDAFCAAFTHAHDALAAALAAQRHLQVPASNLQLRVRIGLHSGEADAQDDNYPSSLTLIRAQRVMSVAHGGQTLVSQTTATLLEAHRPDDASLRALGAYRLRGLTQPEPIFQLIAPDLPADFPPLRGAELATSETPLLQRLAFGQLVGRARELAQLREGWSQASSGRGQLILIAGEPGVGKTRLCEALRAHAHEQHATILRGGCYEYEATTPYLPFVEALRDWVHAQTADALRQTLEPLASELVKLAPEIETKLGARPPNPTLTPNEERLRLFDHVARFLQTLAGRNGLLLLLDDLHWADQGTLTLLSYLLRHLRNERVLVVAAYRDVELDRAHPLAAALVDWHRERLSTRISLGRLSLAETNNLLASLLDRASVSDEFASVIYRETEGNPFFVEEVVRSLVESGLLYREDEQWQRKPIDELQIPQSVKEAIGRRLSRLSAPCADMLHTAAVLGKVFQFGELAAAVTVDENQLLDSLDEASTAQLIRAESGDAFAFTHDKIREVLYNELNAIRRRRLHQRVGESLEALYAASLGTHAPDTSTKFILSEAEGLSASLSHHFMQSGDLPRALNYSLRAAQNAARVFAHDEALAYYEHARECAESLHQPEQVAAIDEAIGDTLNLFGKHAVVNEYYTRAFSLALSRERRAVLMGKIGRTYSYQNDERSLELLQKALQELDSSTLSSELQTVLVSIATQYSWLGKYSQALDFAERAYQLEQSHNLTVFQPSLTVQSRTYRQLARLDESLEYGRKLLALAESQNNLLNIANGYEFMAEALYYLGRWQEALTFATQDKQIAEKNGFKHNVAWAEHARAWAHHGYGNLKAAIESARVALEVANSIGEQRSIVSARAILAIIETDLGLDDAARVDAEHALVHGDGLGELLLRCMSRNAMAYLHLQRNEWDAAVEWCNQCAAILAGTEERVVPLVMWPNHAEACLGAGRLNQAAQIITEHLALARYAKSRHYEGIALRVQGQIFAVQQQYEEAARSFGESITMLNELGSRFELGRALYQRGLLHQRLGARDAARADLTGARDLFDACEARRDWARAEQALEGL